MIQSTRRTPSFRRAGRPGDGRPFCVGRWPRRATRVARSGIVWCVMAWLASAPTAAGASPAPGSGSSREPITASRQGRADGRDQQQQSPPYRVLLRSLALPGWGQLENDQPLKAALVVLAEAGFMAAGFIELRRSDRAFEAHLAAANAGDEGEAERQFVFYEDRHARAVGHFWRGAFTIMLSALDAYVDAHLRDFRADEVDDEMLSRAAAAVAGPYAPAPALHVGPALDRQRVGLAVRISF